MSLRALPECDKIKWQKDGDVPKCPTCSKSFGFITKRHHCRFCGIVVCADCSAEGMVSSSTAPNTAPRACSACQAQAKQPPPQPAKQPPAQPAKQPAPKQSSAKPAASKPATSPAVKAHHTDPSPVAPAATEQDGAKAVNSKEIAMGNALCCKINKQKKAMKQFDTMNSTVCKVKELQEIVETGGEVFGMIPVVGVAFEAVSGLISSALSLFAGPIALSKHVGLLFERISAIAEPLREDIGRMKREAEPSSELLQNLESILSKALKLVEKFAPGAQSSPVSFLNIFNPKKWEKNRESEFAEIHTEIDRALAGRVYALSVRAPTIEEIRQALLEEEKRMTAMITSVERSVEQLQEGQELTGRKLQQLDDRISELQQESQFYSAGLKWRKLEEPSQLQINQDSIIGEDDFFVIVEGTYKGTPVAVKIVKKAVLLSATEEFFTEAALLTAHQTEHIVSFYGVHRSSGQVMLVEELGVASLAEFLDELKEKPLSTELAFSIVHDVLKALCYLHRRGVIHRGICPKNIVLCEHPTEEGKMIAKIGGFGRAKKDESSASFWSNARENVRYCAPEVLDETKDVHAALVSDCYSLGVVIWELLTGRTPWESFDEQQVVAKVLSGDRLNCDIITSDVVGSDLSTLFEDLHSRPSIEEVREMVLEWQSSEGNEPSSPLARQLRVPPRDEFATYSKGKVCQFLSRQYPPADPEEEDQLMPISRRSRVWECIQRDQWDGEMLLDSSRDEIFLYFGKTSDSARLWDRIQAVKKNGLPSTKMEKRYVPWRREWLRMSSEDRMAWLKKNNAINFVLRFAHSHTAKELLELDIIENDLKEPSASIPPPHQKKFLQLMRLIVEKSVAVEGFDLVNDGESAAKFLNDVTRAQEAGNVKDYRKIVQALADVCFFVCLGEADLVTLFLRTLTQLLAHDERLELVKAGLVSMLGAISRSKAMQLVGASAPTDAQRKLVAEWFEVLKAIKKTDSYQQWVVYATNGNLVEFYLALAPLVTEENLKEFLGYVAAARRIRTKPVTIGDGRCFTGSDALKWLIEHDPNSPNTWTAALTLAVDKEEDVVVDGKSLSLIDLALRLLESAKNAPEETGMAWFWLLRALPALECSVSIDENTYTAREVLVHGLELAISKRCPFDLFYIASRMAALELKSIEVFGKEYTQLDLVVMSLEFSDMLLCVSWEGLSNLPAVKKDGVVIQGKHFNALDCALQGMKSRKEMTPTSCIQVANAMTDSNQTVEYNGITFTKMQLIEKAIEIAQQTGADSFTIWSSLARWLSKGETVTMLGQPYSKVQCLAKALTFRPSTKSHWLFMSRALEVNETVTILDEVYNRIDCLLKLVQIDPSPKDVESWRRLATLMDSEQKVIIKGEAFSKMDILRTALQLNPCLHATWMSVAIALPEKVIFEFDGKSIDKVGCYKMALSTATDDEQRGLSWSRIGNAMPSGKTIVIDDVTYDEMACWIKAVTFNPKLALPWANLSGPLREKKCSATIHGKEYNAVECAIESILADESESFGWYMLAKALGDKGYATVEGQKYNNLDCFAKYCAIPGKIAGNLAMAYRTIGDSLSDSSSYFTVGERKMTKKDCYVRVVSLLPSSGPITWATLAAEIARTGEAIVDGKKISAENCIEKALSLEKANAAYIYSTVARGVPFGGTINVGGEALGKMELAIKAVELNANDLSAWWSMVLAFTVGDVKEVKVSGNRVSQVDCCVKYLELTKSGEVSWLAWKLIANSRTVTTITVKGQTFTRLQCFEQALQSTTSPASRSGIWIAMAQNMFGTEKQLPVLGKVVTQSICAVNALNDNFAEPEGWWIVGQQLKPGQDEHVKIAEKNYSMTFCFQQFLKLSKDVTRYGEAYYKLGLSMAPRETVDVGNVKASRLQCFLTAVAWDEKQPLYWAAVVEAMGQNSVVRVKNVSYTKAECEARAQAK